MLEKQGLWPKRLLVQIPVTSEEMWVKKTNNRLPFLHQRTQLKASQSRFGVRPVFPHPFFITPLPSLGDHHKNLLYKRNINLYNYLQREGRGNQGI